MYAILAFVPIILVIILMVAFNVQAKKAIPTAWLLCCLLAYFFWKMSVGNLPCLLFWLLICISTVIIVGAGLV